MTTEREIRCFRNLMGWISEHDDEFVATALDAAGMTKTEADEIGYGSGIVDKMKEPIPEKARSLWEEFGDVPIDNNDCITEDWNGFEAGTDRFDIWHWFEEEFGISVAYMQGNWGC